MIRFVTRPGSFEAGFTIIEMVVVVAIIALLAGVLTPMLFNILDDANESATQKEMASLRDAALRYYEHVRQWPPTWVTDGQDVYSGLILLAVTETERGYLLPCSESGEVFSYTHPVWAYDVATGAGWKGPYIADSEGGTGLLYDAWDKPYAYVSYPGYYVVSTDTSSEVLTQQFGGGYEAVPIQPARVFVASKGRDQMHTDYYAPTVRMKTEYDLYPENKDDIIVILSGSDYAKGYWFPMRAENPYE